MNITINIGTIISNIEPSNEEPDFEFDLDADAYEDLARAEQALYETAGEEAEATSGYWDEVVDEVAKEFSEQEGETETVKLARKFAPGDRVLQNGDITGPAIGSVGQVVEIDEHGLILVAWDGWTAGHDNNGEPGNLWWMLPHDLKSLTLKEGSLVVYKGTASGDTGVSLTGKIGYVIDLEEGALVRFIGWTDGHDGFGDEIHQTSYWWVSERDLEVIG